MLGTGDEIRPDPKRPFSNDLKDRPPERISVTPDGLANVKPLEALIAKTMSPLQTPAAALSLVEPFLGDREPIVISVISMGDSTKSPLELARGRQVDAVAILWEADSYNCGLAGLRRG